MSTTYRTTLPTRALVAGLLTGSLGLLTLGVQPIVLGEMVNEHRASLDGVGLVAMAEIVALALGVLLGDVALQRLPVRWVAAVAAVLSALCDIASAYGSGDGVLIGLRALAGISEGVLTWVAISAIVRSAAVERNGAHFATLQTALQAVLALALALVVIPQGGLAAALLAMAGCKLLTLLLLVHLPTRFVALQDLAPAQSSPQSPRAPEHVAMHWTWPRVGSLVLPLLHFSAAIAVWAFLEPVGLLAGVDAQSVQVLVFVALLAQILSAFTASRLIDRWRETTVLPVGSLLMAVIIGCWATLTPGMQWAFYALALALALLWIGMMSFHYKLSMHLDPSGRVTSLVGAAQLLGSACGPLVSSVFVTDTDVRGAFPVGGAFAVLALLLSAAISWHTRSSTRSHHRP